MINFNFDEIKKEKSESNIIAMGETTHKHVIKQKENVELFKSMEDECLLLRVLKPSTITHEEHNEVELFSTNWKRRFVVEKDHVNDIIREVRD